MYHLHIPSPDPMTNPSTLARAEFCSVRGTPSYAIDGQMASGGGGRDEAVSDYETLNTQIEEKLEEEANARINLSASLKDGVISVQATVDAVTSGASELRLQIALVENELTYSGQNNLRFHPMVVRSMGGDKHLGFVIDKSGETTIEQTFNIEAVTNELKQHLADYEVEHEMTFTQKKHEMDPEKLSIVAFVQDTESKRVLQASDIRIKSH